MDPTKLTGKLFYAVIIGAAAWLVGRAVSLAIHRYLDRAQAEGADATGIRFLGQLGKLVVYVVAFLSYRWFGSVLLGIVLAPLVVGAFGAGF